METNRNSSFQFHVTETPRNLKNILDINVIEIKLAGRNTKINSELF